MPKLLTALAALALTVIAPADDPVPFLDALPAARVAVQGDELVFELPPTDLPAGLTHEMMEHGRAAGSGGPQHGHAGHGGGANGQRGPGWPDVSLVTLPVSGAMYAFRVELVDSAGTRLPSELLHHINLIDPFHRELFLPISRRVIAAGKETGAQRLPWFLFGLPFRKGERLVLSAMLHNPGAIAYRGVRTRLVIEFTPGVRPWPLWDAFPWQLDVLFPVGDKSFDLPPGRSSRAFEARPAIAGKILGLGGHVHERAVRISLTDVTTGTVLWEGAPATDSAGRVTGVPVAKFYRWNRIGLPIDTSHSYRVLVEYENATPDTIPQGGMGVIGGLFVPRDADAWPAADVTDPLYLTDLRHYLRLRPDTPVPTAAARHVH
jgi:hypothetical protein